jgi:GTPase KRas protein
LRVVVIGDVGAGKSTLILRFCKNSFVYEYDPTIEDSYRRTVTLLGAAVMVEAIDTSGSEEFTALRHQWLRESEAIALCVDISLPAKEAFSSALELLQSHGLRATGATADRKKSVFQHGDELLRRPILLIATKCDLPRQTSGQELVAFARANKTGLIVTSAKNLIRITEVFQECVRYVAAGQADTADVSARKKGCCMM